MLLVNWLNGLKWRLWLNRFPRRIRTLRPRKRPGTFATGINPLEDRVLLSGMAPFAMADSYDVQYDSFSTSALSLSSVLANDSDMEWDPLTASLVSSVSHGSLTLNSNGHFVYTPDAGYSGSDSFVYQAYDGTGYSSNTTVSLTVTGTFSDATNLEDRPAEQPQVYGELGVLLQTGAVITYQEVAPGHYLMYDSTTDPHPIITVETDYQLDMLASAPSTVEAQLTLDSITGANIYYSGGGLYGGADTIRFSHQVDASSLSTGRYDYTFDTVANFSGGNTSTRAMTGTTHIVNRNASEFGDNWSLAELNQLHIDTSGVLFVSGTNQAFWFEDNSGTFISPAGPLAHSTLVENGNGTYTLTDKYGNEQNFSSTGLLTSRVDFNGNTTSYAYTDADSDTVSDEIDTITDPFSRVTTFAYTSGLLSSVTDFASRVTSIAHDGSGRVSSITQPDPDGAGPQSAPVTSFTYDTTIASQLVTITDPRSKVTEIDYDFTGRFDEATLPCH